MIWSFYRQASLHAWLARVNWMADNIVATLHSSSYVPQPDTDAYVSDLSGELLTGLGYTAGGQVLGGRAASYVPANSWADIWAPVTVYVTGQIVRPITPNGQLYRCITGGTSGASVPSFPAEGLTVTDGSVTWAAVGPGGISLAASTLQWPGFSASFRYLVVSDRTPSSASAQPLIALGDMGSVATGTGGPFSVTFDQMGALVLCPA
jgi:hypothetical protein